MRMRKGPMAKRSGKANSRRQRQRSAARPPLRPAAAPPPRVDADEPETAATTSTTMPAARPEPEPRRSAGSTPPRPRAAAVATQLYGGSRLSERAAAEYHYVAADLRNILVLSVVLVVLLGVAFVVVNVLGIGKQV